MDSLKRPGRGVIVRRIKLNSYGGRCIMWLIVFICLSADFTQRNILSSEAHGEVLFSFRPGFFFNVLMFILMSVVLIHVVYVYSGAYAPYFGMK